MLCRSTYAYSTLKLNFPEVFLQLPLYGASCRVQPLYVFLVQNAVQKQFLHLQLPHQKSGVSVSLIKCSGSYSVLVDRRS